METLISREKLPILLAEYNALRAQLLQRDTIINQVLSIAGTLTLGFLSFLMLYSIVGGILLAVIAIPCLVFVFRLNESDMLVTASRLEELRAEINNFAGEPLLKSENAKGQSTMGYIPDFQYATRPFLRIGDAMTRMWHRRTSSV